MIKAIVGISALAVAAGFVTPAARQSSTLKMFDDDDRSIALPFDKKPKNLDGTLAGDYGFDPAGFSNNPPSNLLWGVPGLKWYREAEIVHSRVAMLAVVGMLVPGWFGHFAGNPDAGVAVDAYAELNPFKALSVVPETGLWHITVAIFAVEIWRINNVIKGDRPAGDLNLGQGGWNPFGFNYTPEEYFEKQVQEIKHGRLAMIAILAELLQVKASGVSITEQLSGAFTYPEQVGVPAGGMGTLGDYFPPNI
mmetsp:Transcript_18556/g.18633  ORF Transcript_18556/g.18633 Transcript_18556/m.18633 type:complete len:251 (+) Transcript_18556:54-806(+)|eukprot:CAMPEP_0182427574 /NCGR_PEP_ID=MMETSP1167-20130531/18583_1 /TAXON_ID=2988 /ORGANISM="Mallomonas Sp, Strain CCMP3275" /LENGTH=250 /DNA_ID=CAMNT_0024609899 /DNA_START=52 /DNA_END=804 /DNA_ORIENTATION=+